MRTLVAIAFILIAMPAYGQQQSTPLEQALSGKLIEEINSNIQLRAQLLQAQARVKELEEQTKPKADKK